MDWISAINEFMRQFHFKDAVDIFIVFVIVYEILKLMRGTRAVQMLYGILFFTAVYAVSYFFHLETLQFVVRNAVLYFGFAVIIIFQSEIRTALAHFGKNLSMPFGFRVQRQNKSFREFYDEIVLAATSLASEKIGALMVLERTVGLQDHINHGIRLDAVPSYDLLVTIFNPNTPLHDGAVIVRNFRIAAASCFLPLTLNPRLSKDLGTRHRAAIGITEESDAVAVVVSEETGVISFVERGQITRNLDSVRLRHMLARAFESQRVSGRSFSPDRRLSELEKSLTPSTVPVSKPRGVFDPQPSVTKE
jgi:uncharacterized protein (TIGR00159 family)